MPGCPMGSPVPTGSQDHGNQSVQAINVSEAMKHDRSRRCERFTLASSAVNHHPRPAMCRRPVLSCARFLNAFGILRPERGTTKKCIPISRGTNSGLPMLRPTM